MIEPDVFELTKLAALAIGFEYEVEGEVGYIKANGDGPKIMVFNPANDVVDSLMLEQTLRINIQWESDGVRASFAPSDGQRQDFFQYFSPYSDFQGDRKKAKMYAVLQCAAQYGSSKVKEVPDNHISLLSRICSAGFASWMSLTSFTSAFGSGLGHFVQLVLLLGIVQNDRK